MADRVAVSRRQLGYAIPYYTRGGGDTEYLISNPNGHTLTAALFVFGKQCKVAKGIRFRLGPHCTKTFRLRPIVPEHAGHSVLIADDEMIVHLVYLSGKNIAVVSGELAGRANLLGWHSAERARTYGFGYRALPLGPGPLNGAAFVSNPNGFPLAGLLVYFDQRCRPVKQQRVAIKPGCRVPLPARQLRLRADPGLTPAGD